MKFSLSDNIIYLLIMFILFIAIILKYLCTTVFKCKKKTS